MASAAQWQEDDLALLRTCVPGHVPPVRRHGFELSQHKKIADRHLDRLHDVEMPADWRRPVPYATRTALMSGRAAEMRPHASFDVDGDGFVSPKDFAIARKHDLGGGGQLEDGQRKSAIAETCLVAGSALRDSEIGGNRAVRRLMESLKTSPAVDDNEALSNRLRMANRMTASLRMKSSEQLKGCLRFPEPAAAGPQQEQQQPASARQPPLGAPPPMLPAADAAAPAVTTRSALLERRRAERTQQEVQGQQRFHAEYGPRSF